MVTQHIAAAAVDVGLIAAVGYLLRLAFGRAS